MGKLLSSSSSSVPAGSTIPWAGLIHLFIVYVVWGSTYLAIRVAVREGAGFPPFALGASRVLLAGGLLILWAVLTRNRWRPTPKELAVLAATGLLLWTGGNGMVNWAEQRADSGYAALLVGSLPIWVALIEAILDRRLPSLLFVFSLLVGFAGVGLLTLPVLSTGTRSDILSVLALILAPICWGLGSIIQQRRPVELTVPVCSGYQHLFGGFGFLVLTIATGEPLPNPTPEAWLAWGYLLVFGSLIAFTSFIMAIRLLPMNIVMTYPYVNPVIAVILGWLILGEEITATTISGMLLVLLGVAGVFRDRYRMPPKATGRPEQVTAVKATR
ncbi:MAG: EamA family transporter [Bacillota bacterium]